MKKIIISIIVVIIGAFVFVFFRLAQDGFDITVENKTNQEISGLYFTYDNIKSEINIPSIASGDTYSLNINPKEHFNDDFFDESALTIEYKDSKGNLQTEYVIGYFEKGYSGTAAINIKSVDENGKLNMEIENDISLY